MNFKDKLIFLLILIYQLKKVHQAAAITTASATTDPHPKLRKFHLMMMTSK